MFVEDDDLFIITWFARPNTFMCVDPHSALFTEMPPICSGTCIQYDHLSMGFWVCASDMFDGLDLTLDSCLKEVLLIHSVLFYRKSVIIMKMLL